MSFADQVKAEMKRRHVSQQWLAQHAGLDKATVSRMLARPGVGTLNSWTRVAVALEMRWELVPRPDKPDTIN